MTQSYLRGHSRHIELTLHERALEGLGLYLSWLHQRGDWSDVESLQRKIRRRTRAHYKTTHSRLLRVVLGQTNERLNRLERNLVGGVLRWEKNRA